MSVEVKVVGGGEEMDNVGWESVRGRWGVVNEGCRLLEYEYEKSVERRNGLVGVKMGVVVRGKGRGGG